MLYTSYILLTFYDPHNITIPFMQTSISYTQIGQYCNHTLFSYLYFYNNSVIIIISIICTTCRISNHLSSCIFMNFHLASARNKTRLSLDVDKLVHPMSWSNCVCVVQPINQIIVGGAK